MSGPPAPAPPDGHRPSALVDADWVAARLGQPGLVLLEVDDRPALYHLGHPPGARLLGWADLQDPVRRDVPGPDAVAELWRRVGVREGSTVVFYGDLHNWLAAFGCWLFKAYGLADVRLLDGGRQHWVTQERPTTREVPPPPADAAGAGGAVRVPVPRFRPELRAGRADVVRAARRGGLLDVRTPEEYVGEWLSEPEFPGESAQRAGHIPGAANVPWDLAVDPDGRLKPAEELRRLFYGAAGLRPDVPAVAYCRIGERSAHTWFVLHELLGHPDVRNYDGSWTEWGSMVGMPVQRGPEPGRLPAGFAAD